jgi:hypothetical protein
MCPESRARESPADSEPLRQLSHPSLACGLLELRVVDGNVMLHLGDLDGEAEVRSHLVDLEGEFDAIDLAVIAEPRIDINRALRTLNLALVADHQPGAGVEG